jgi:hypothetical protein
MWSSTASMIWRGSHCRRDEAGDSSGRPVSFAIASRNLRDPLGLVWQHWHEYG